MRQLNHLLVKSKSGKSIILKIEINDKYGKQKINFSILKGWRMFLIEKYLLGSSEEWTDDVARKFIAMKVLTSAKNEFEGAKFLNIVKNHSTFEIHFWASKFMLHDKTSRSWKILYD